METEAPRLGPECAPVEGHTRQRLARILLQEGASTARELAARLDITPTAVRKHLDSMVAEGLAAPVAPSPESQRGRGRPARSYRLTEAARDTFGHHYDDLAAQALRWIAENAGAEAVAAFASDQLAGLERRCREAMDAASEDAPARAAALARALTREGYAATAGAVAAGGQVCQHHCPVSHVAAEFPQLCEAETAVISRLVGRHVQRLATIANGDGVCTTYIPPTPQPASLTQNHDR